MCFLSPDSESPFGSGGINPYAYCAGDPVNRIDPDGHSWVNYALAGAGIALGVAALIASLGTVSSILAATTYIGSAALTPSAVMVVGAAALDIVSLGTGVASLVAEISGADQSTVDILGWVSFATGLTGGILSGAARKSVSIANRRPTKGLRWEMDAQIISDEGMYFHKKLWDDYVGFQTHGGADGTLMNSRGIQESAKAVAKREIAPRLKNVPMDEPLVLIACQGGSSGAAQAVANVLRRPVIGYDEVIYATAPGWMGKAGTYWTPNGFTTTTPLQRIPHLKHLKGFHGPNYYSSGPDYELATFKMYYPA
jgi:hypothetical protein